MERLRLAFVELLRFAFRESPPPICIPDELIREILLRLPVKSLVRFKCVCKSWKLIISEPQFVKQHLHCRSSTNTADTQLLFDLFDFKLAYLAFSRLVFRLFGSYDIFPCSKSLLFSSQNQKGRIFYPIENGYNLIAVCNGLVSLIKLEFDSAEEISCTGRVCLWNPATRIWSQMSPPLYFVEGFHKYIFGFGYDCLNDTYKVVAVNRIEEREQCVVKVYNMGDSCWRNIKSFMAPTLMVWSWQDGVYVSGTLNWVVMIKNTNMYIIASLDLAMEEYLHLPLPNSSQHAENLYFPLLGVLKDCLCILHSDGNTGFLIWQMKKFGTHKYWTQIFNFNFEGNRHMLPTFFSLVGFILSENIDEVLLITNYALVLYNKRDNKFKFNREFSKDPNLYFMDSWNVKNYVESLTLPY